MVIMNKDMKGYDIQKRSKIYYNDYLKKQIFSSFFSNVYVLVINILLLLNIMFIKHVILMLHSLLIMRGGCVVG